MNSLSDHPSAGEDLAQAITFRDLRVVLLLGSENRLAKIADQLRMYGVRVVEVSELQVLAGVAVQYELLAVVGSPPVCPTLQDLLNTMVDSRIHAPIIAVVDGVRTQAVLGDSVTVLDGPQGASWIAAIIATFWNQTSPGSGQTRGSRTFPQDL